MKKPKKEMRNFTIRMPKDIHEFIVERSEKERVSMNNWMLRMIDQLKLQNAVH